MVLCASRVLSTESGVETHTLKVRGTRLVDDDGVACARIVFTQLLDDPFEIALIQPVLVEVVPQIRTLG